MLGSRLNQPFFRSIAVLFTGTVIAQAIGYLLAPVISRLFTPEETGEFSAWYRLVALLATLATARYEMAISLPESDVKACFLVRLSLRLLLTALVFTALFYLISSFWKQELEILHYGAWVILGIAGVAGLNILMNWATRQKDFQAINASKISTALFTNFSRVGAGLLQWGKWGMIASMAFGTLVGLIPLVLKSRLEWDKKTVKSDQSLKNVAREFKSFPLNSLPHALVDTARDFILALLVISVFSESIQGQFDHSFRMLRIPLLLIGTASAQVFYRQIAERINEKKSIFELVKKMTLFHGAIGVIPFTVLFFFGKPLFAWIFGEQWALSGEISAWLAPWLFLNFLVSPLSVLPLALNRQGSFFILGAFSSIGQLAVCYFVPKAFISIEEQVKMTFIVLSATQVIFSLITLYYHYYITKHYQTANAN